MRAPGRELAPGLWTVERPQRVAGLELGARMTVVRIRERGLWLHSPVGLDDVLRRRLDALGTVRYVVAPNRFHHLHVADYARAYPSAKRYAAPGLPEKRPGVHFHEVLDDVPPPEWGGVLDVVVFRAIPATQEVIFFHKPSRTLILTDLAFNLREDRPPLTRAVFTLLGGQGRLQPTRLTRWLIRERRAARRLVDRILAWNFHRVIVSHGDVVEIEGHEHFRDAFAWLLR